MTRGELIIGTILLIFTAAIGLAQKSANPRQNRALAVGDDDILRLIGRQWKLIEIPGKPIPSGGFQAYFELKENERLDNGSIGELIKSSPDGCNGLTGSYELQGSSLHFDHLVTTAMLCLPTVPDKYPASSPSATRQLSIAEQTRLFLKALRGALGFRIEGSILEFLGRNEEILARLESSTQH